MLSMRRNKDWMKFVNTAILLMGTFGLVFAIHTAKYSGTSGNVLHRTIRSTDTGNPAGEADMHADNKSSNDTSDHGNSTGHRFEVAHIDFQRVAGPFLITVWIIFGALAKLIFQFFNTIVSKVPESCVIICLGLVVGGIAYAANQNAQVEEFIFNPDLFFLFILPPIVMEAGYFMPKGPFFENLEVILAYAIIGTVFNALAIGASLYGCWLGGVMPGLENLNILQCLLFGSIISAVDPVAVISVFEEIHVNTVLYICVFGESLLNDGVAVVLFKVFEGYIEIGQENILPIDIGMGILSFFIVAFGALFVGIIIGYTAAFISKYTVDNRIIEPIFVFCFCYLAYLVAEIFHLSGIIAIVFAAFTMSTFVQKNVSRNSQITLKYSMKMLAHIAESIIFMLLGISIVSHFWNDWNTGFILWTLLFVTVYRFISVFVLTALLNPFRLVKIGYLDQFVMAYSGLRGAIAFGLVSLIAEEHVPIVGTMICACIVVILFTSFVQGATIRPIVEYLKVKTARKDDLTMFEEVNSRVMDHLTVGIEDITGDHGQHHWMQYIYEVYKKYLFKWFVRDSESSTNEELFEIFHRINQRDAEELVQEFEEGKTDIKTVETLTNVLLPMEMRENYSRSAFNANVLEPVSFEVGPGKDEKELEKMKSMKDTEVQHLLHDNLYQPRRREASRYARGEIDAKDETKKQEQEIIMRHKLHKFKRLDSHRRALSRRGSHITEEPSTASRAKDETDRLLIDEKDGFTSDQSKPSSPIPPPSDGVNVESKTPQKQPTEKVADGATTSAGGDIEMTPRDKSARVSAEVHSSDGDDAAVIGSDTKPIIKDDKV